MQKKAARIRKSYHCETTCGCQSVSCTASVPLYRQARGLFPHSTLSSDLEYSPYCYLDTENIAKFSRNLSKVPFSPLIYMFLIHSHVQGRKEKTRFLQGSSLNQKLGRRTH